MGDYSTESLELPSPGPYLGIVINNLDPDLMGGLEVLLYEGAEGDILLQGNTVTVKYLPSFWGTTSVRWEGNDSSKFDDVQKSYGMWFVPPDLYNTVMCIFPGGDRNNGFWFGVVPDRFQDHMVPGIASSTNVAMTPEQERKYGTKNLPVAEFNKKTRRLDSAKVNEFTKPIHPFADRLLAQGLLLDDIRGITSSSARREHPSGVFGISTPGPVDTSVNAPKRSIGPGDSVNAFISRLGGHTLVMDDGDKRGLNELFRIRTRTGHQILLHNSSDLIYIANAAGTAWIELTAQGKIDIYAADSVSIHAEGDFNLRADRDFNIEALRDINISAGGNIKTETAGEYSINGARDAVISFDGTYNLSARTMAIAADNTLDLKVGDATRFVGAGPIDIKGTAITVEATGILGLKATDLKMSASKTAGLKGDTSLTLSSAGVLNVNGPPAPTAPSAAAIAITPVEPSPLPLYQLPNRTRDVGWSDGKLYASEDILSITKRVPTHEPYQQHENINPQQFSYDNTDLEVDNRGKGLPGKNPSVNYNATPAVQGTPPAPTGNKEEDNITAYLWMIRCCEGTSGPNGYRTRFGPVGSNLFDVDDSKLSTYQYKDHPRKGYTYPTKAGTITSTAAGAYQFLSKTWDSCVKALALPDFSPRSQDLACIHLLRQARALDDIKNGNFTSAINKTKRIWASLPGDVYGQGGKNFTQALSYFKQGGGTFVA